MTFVSVSPAGRHALEPGDRVCLAPGQVARVLAGTADARAVPYDDGRPRGAGIFIAALTPTGIAIGLSDTVRVELVAPAACEVLIAPLPDALNGGDTAQIDAWLRAVDAVGAWIPFTAPRALFPGLARLRSGDIVAAPREQTVWFQLGDAWWPLTDGAPLRWDGPPEVEIVTTGALLEAAVVARALASWAAATSMRLTHVLETIDAARARAVATGARAAGEAVLATRDAIAGIAEAETAARGQSEARRALAWAIPGNALAPVRDGPGSELRDGARFASFSGIVRITRAAAGLSNLALPEVLAPDPAAPEAEAAEPFDSVRTEAAKAGIGVREIAIPARLTSEDGPPLVVRFEGPEEDSRPGAVRSIGGRYAVFDVDRGRVPRAGARFGTRGLALTLPLDTALLAALETPRRLLAALLRLSPGDAIGALLLGLAGVGLGAMVPVATNLLFSAVWPRADWNGHWLIVSGLAIAALAGIGFDAARSARSGRLAMRFLNRLEDGTWLALVRASPGALAGRSAGDLQNRLGAAGRLRQAILGQPVRAITDGAMLLTSAALMAIYGGSLAWIGVAAVILLMLTWSLLLRQSVGARTATETIAGRESALLSQAIAAVVKVKATASEPFLLARWARLASQRRQAVRRAERIETVIAVATVGVTSLSTALVFYLGYLLVATAQAGAGPPATGSITLGAFLAFQTALGQTIAAASSVSSIFGLWPRLSAAGAMLAPLARTEPETTATSLRSPAPALDGRVEIAQVTHQYEGAATQSLRGVDIAIAAREYAGIVGPSGSGKSTLLRLILGLEQPASGAIYFDGLDARRLDPASIRRQIGYVGQDARLAPGSILNNILDGRIAGAPEAWAAARLAGIAEDIEAMPMGMHTLVGEAGQNLSGGQRQRLMIARALLTRPRILIFDEATSALDNRAQAVVQNGLGDLPVTRIIVAHRLSTVMGVDRVFVLDRGRVVETGPPAELLRQGGAFATLANRQRIDPATPGVP